MKRFWFNLLWYLGAVIITDLLPISAFFALHMSQGIGNLAPQIISSGLFFIILAGQAFLHLHILHKRYPGQENKNIRSALTVTLLVFLTYWLIIIGAIIWVISSPGQ